jgi:protease I
LKNRRIAVLAADGFEKVELTIPVAALKATGAEVDIVSLRRGRIRGVNLHEPASRVRVTCTIEEASPRRYDALLVPGAFINPDLLRQSAAAREFVRAFDSAGKPIATLCHGPWLLASAGLLADRTLTSWPGIRDDMVNAGAIWLDEAVVRDRNLVTSRGPQDMVPFVRAMLDHFAGAEARRPAEPRARTSSPQRDQPPAAMVKALEWMPRPSIRTALGLGVAAVAALAAVSRRVA